MDNARLRTASAALLEAPIDMSGPTADPAVLRAAPPPDHPRIAQSRVGVLIVNLGTPSAPTPTAVRAYLGEFLADRRIVDFPRAIWLLALHLIILNVRPPRTARAYAEIWRRDTNESPLRYFTRRQSDRLADRLGARFLVDWAMRYGEPSIRGRLTMMAERGARRILALPLYPQYSATTTASVSDALFAAASRLAWQPTLRLAPPFFDDSRYIAALRRTTNRELENLNFEPERVVVSFHGLPQRYFERGDPYPCHCAKTARLLREAMGWSEEFAPLAFQSKFGPGAWVRPSTEETLARLAREGVRRVAVTTPGFVSDCLETLEEIAIRAKQSFLAAGGERFAALPCLNDSDEAIDALADLIERETAGWSS